MSGFPTSGRGGRARGRGYGGGQWRGRGNNWRGRGSRGGRGGWRGAQSQGAGNTNSHNNSNNDSFQIVAQNSQSSQQRITSLFDIVPGPYRGWKLYFHLEGYAEGSTTVKKIKAVETFIKKHRRMYPPTEVEERRSYALDIKLISSDENFKTEWPTFKDDLEDEPEHSIGCLGLGMHQVVLLALEEEARAQLTDLERAQLPPHNLAAIRARILNHEPVLQLKTLKSNYFGKLVSVRGTVIRVGNLKLSCVWMAFSCNTCSSIQCVRQPQGKYTLPTKCSSDGCRARSFAPKHASPFTQTVNYQSIRLQEISDDEHREGGRVPRSVEVELMEDLVDSCAPGDVVTVTGIIRVHNTEESSNKQKNSSMFLLYIEAASIMNNKKNSAGGKSSVGVEFNLKDYYAIQEIHAEPALFRLLVNSLCPMIFGHEIVKAGLLLALIGGAQFAGRDSRSDSHILVVGDPGLGKSQMLQACASVAPRGVYVCGNTSTTSGLTVTLSRESGGDYALEAGALVLADQGSCCIDEFDKMSTQHQALLEAMEQQSISIAKAGVVCSLPARTSILAAANPVSGHYNRAKTVSENLRMGQALLSRFDLVFILMDQPNEHLDNLLSEHVMALHSGFGSRGSVSGASSSQSKTNVAGDGEVPLSERLRLYANETFDPIPHQLLRKYIAYARKYVNPTLSEDASAVLKQFYLDLRKKHHTADSAPVTTRQLESLIRLTEARAKLELREKATYQDALDVVEIFRSSLVDSFADELGTLDFNRSQNGSGMSSRNKAKKFIAVLQRRSELQSKSLFSAAEMREVAQTCGVMGADFFDFVNTLNTQGFLLKKGNQTYQLVSAGH
ncbi:DNA helicase MCM8 [Frankliniella occidentalis]|uniref:DNA helicase MCM8 n=1 Tax=Frankliniella occidentalis TaxID=133901 RepID=A0A6J1SW79_FRAOC|nr:DNA helicase MCM8 [Frankliniella occidentalis]